MGSLKGYDWDILRVKKKSRLARLFDPISPEHKVLVRHRGRKLWVGVNLDERMGEINWEINRRIWRKFYRETEAAKKASSLLTRRTRRGKKPYP